MNVHLRVTADTADGRTFHAEHTVRRVDRMSDGGNRLERLMLADLLGDLARALYAREIEIDRAVIAISREARP